MRLVGENSPEMTVQTRYLDEAIEALAMKGDVESFIRYVSENAFGKLSDYDLQQFDEKYIKILLLAYLFINKHYVPMSEYETVPGRADIYLQRSPLIPEIRYEWLFELKYCKASASENEIAAKREQGLEQVRGYALSHRMKDRTDLKAALIIFIGKDRFEITEI
jgi:hypothetical protein